MRDGTRAFFQIRGIFHYFRSFKTEILQMHSLIGQILIPLSVASRLGKYPTLAYTKPVNSVFRALRLVPHLRIS